MADDTYFEGEDMVTVLVERLDDTYRVAHIPSIHTRTVRVPSRMARRWERWCGQEDLIQAEMRCAPTIEREASRG